MLPGLTLPASLRRLLGAFTPCFTKPTFVVFTAMVVGMVTQTGSRTVCGMLAGAGLAQTWSHDRVHRFFAGAVWSIDAGICQYLWMVFVVWVVGSWSFGGWLGVRPGYAMGRARGRLCYVMAGTGVASWSSRSWSHRLVAVRA